MVVVTIDEWIYMMFLWKDEFGENVLYNCCVLRSEFDICNVRRKDERGRCMREQLSASVVTKKQVWSGTSPDASVRDARLEWSRVWRDREWDLYVILYMYFIIYIKFVNNQCDCHSIHKHSYVKYNFDIVWNYSSNSYSKLWNNFGTVRNKLIVLHKALLYQTSSLNMVYKHVTYYIVCSILLLSFITHL